MAMTGFHVVTIAAGLLLAVSEPGFAAKRASDTQTTAKSKSHVTKSSRSAIRPYSRSLYGREPYPYSRDPDPYAPGVNWPKGA